MDDLVALRERIATAANRRHDIEKTHVDAEEFRRRAAALVAKEQEHASDAMLVHRLAAPSWNSATPADLQIEIAASKYPLGYAAIMLGSDVVLDRLTAQIAPWLAKGMSAGEREAELARLDAEVLDLAVVEEGILRDAEKGGRDIPRRADADPAIVLAIDLGRIR